MYIAKNILGHFLIVTILFLNSCSRLSPAEKELQSALQSTINLDNVSNVVYTGNDSTTFDHLRQKYAFISLVFLQDGCGPCYPNFIRWHTEMQKLNCPENHILLFIINGHNYNDFMANIYDIQPIEGKYYVVMDPKGKYLENNLHIPRWVIERSVLIDAENKVKLVGEPFATPDMTRLFYSIVNDDNKN